VRFGRRWCDDEGYLEEENDGRRSRSARGKGRRRECFKGAHLNPFPVLPPPFKLLRAFHHEPNSIPVEILRPDTVGESSGRMLPSDSKRSPELNETLVRFLD